MMKKTDELARLSKQVKQLKKERDELLEWKRRAEPALHQHLCGTFKAEHADDFKATFEDFWRPIVINADGSWDFDAIKRELSDYATCIMEVAAVYTHITGGILSKPNTQACYVIAAFDRSVDEEIAAEIVSLKEKIRRQSRAFRAVASWIDENGGGDEHAAILKLICQFVKSNDKA